MPSKRVVALVRVSTGEQSTESQRQEIERWAALQGAQVATWYTEEGVSGAARERPVLDRLVADARRGRVGTVVVAELSRLGRSLARVALTMDELREVGVSIVSLREGLDTSTPMGRAMAQMAGVFAELERERIKDRVRAGMRAAKARGRQVGRPALDWRPQDLDELRDLLEAGHSLRQIERDSLLTVFDGRGKPRNPSARSMSQALRPLPRRLEGTARNDPRP